MGAPGTARRGRPAATVLTAPELAARLRLREGLVVAMLETGGWFPGAWQEEDGWRIPERALKEYLGRACEPLFTYAEAASYLGVHKVTVEKAAAAWLRGDAEGIETVEIRLPGEGAKRIPRITMTELLRHVQPARPRF